MQTFIFVAVITSPLWLRILIRLWREERFYRRIEKAFRNANDRNDKTD